MFFNISRMKNVERHGHGKAWVDIVTRLIDNDNKINSQYSSIDPVPMHSGNVL